MRLKTSVESILRFYPPLYRLGSRVYHRAHSEFRTLSPGAPGAIREAFEFTQVDPDALKFVGDYYEFGLFRGGTFLATSRILDDMRLLDVRMYGFDSFQGLPPPAGVDASDPRFFEGQFASSRADVEKNLAERGMNMSRADLIEGFYEDVLTENLHDKYPFQPASVVLFDCDYYSSTKVAMDWLTRYIRPGSVLLFDDWLSYGDSKELGQQKALAEWLDKHPAFSVEYFNDFQWHGRGFVVRIKDPV